jgi:DNA-directed RNA polymerase sigma subunit (sigma70/sigma32)
MSRSTLPLFPTDEGWPYPDVVGFDLVDDDEPDLDALELRADPHAFDGLTLLEREALFSHFGLQGRYPLSMKELGPALGCSRSQARALLGTAIDKVRTRLMSA